MKSHNTIGNQNAILFGAFKRSAPELSLSLREYALSASVRLCDPTKPLLVSLAVEAFIASQALVVWAQSAQSKNPRRPCNRRRAGSDFHPAFEQRKGIFSESLARVSSLGSPIGAEADVANARGAFVNGTQQSAPALAPTLH